MKAEILSIGDELLIGQVVNTNAVWIAQQLNAIGVSVIHMSTIGDSKLDIKVAFDAAMLRSQIVLITGGLGPTKDDITKNTIAEYFNQELIVDSKALQNVESFFIKRGREITQINKDQALVPKDCIVIENASGTAPGMWLSKNGVHFISMPGVPYEMKEMMLKSILPKIKADYKLPVILHKTVLTQGIGESTLADLIETWEDALASKNIKLAYLPQPGVVRLRLSTEGENAIELEKIIDNEILKLQGIIKEYIFGIENYNEEPQLIQLVTSKLLKEKKQTLAIAESCTGGYLSSLFTAIPGSSEIFKGSVTPYSNEAKQNILNVKEETLSNDGAVSEACVIQLAENVRKQFNSNYSISVSGVAGPGGGTDEKPVGFVWMAVSHKTKTIAKSFQFGDNRERNIVMTSNAAINMLRKFILQTEA